MKPHTLVVSNPPHREVDHGKTPRCFGLTPAESRMKANFPAPEIWLAFPKKEAAESAAGSLRNAGLRIIVLDGTDLSSIPRQVPVTSFAFTDTKFVARFGGGDVELPYDIPIIGVFCKPPRDFAADIESPKLADSWGRRSTSVLIERVVGSALVRSQTSVAEALERMTILDLYVSRDDELMRISIAQDVADFSGLGDLKRLGAEVNMATCVAECERRFTKLQIDRRLVNVRPRRRLTVGGAAPQHDDRKLFSFGTLALSKLLESISPDLKDIAQFELGSRLAYLMNR